VITIDQAIEILEEKKEDDNTAGFNNALNFAIDVLKRVELETGFFREDEHHD